MAAPSVAPPASAPTRYHEAAADQRCPRPCSASGVMVDSMERPQGDHVERIPGDDGDQAGADAEEFGHEFLVLLRYAGDP